MPTYPDAEALVVGEGLTEEMINQRKNEQKRLCAYRSLVFWAFPHIRRGERRPLPSCIYAMVRAMFPSIQNEEVYADWQHTAFTYEVAEQND